VTRENELEYVDLEQRECTSWLITGVINFVFFFKGRHTKREIEGAGQKLFFEKEKGFMQKETAPSVEYQI
jgi:hypothetical protein